MPGKVKQPILG